MPRMYIALLLDFFQPPTQGYELIDTIARECYRPVFDMFNAHPNARFTISMANSLARLLVEYGKEDVLESLRCALDSKRIELTHTGASHTIFPLIPEREVRRQIELDIDFKSQPQPFGLESRAGIIAPELSYHDDLIAIYRDLGFRWTVIDDRVMELNGIRVPQAEILHVEDFAVFMRSSFWSDQVTRKADDDGRFLTGYEFVRCLRSEAENQHTESYKIIAISGETFGRPDKYYYEETFLREMLFALAECEEIRLCRISDLLGIPSLRKTAKAREQGKAFTYFPSCSWATHPPDYNRGDFYPHWKSNGNAIHRGLWDLTRLILGACEAIDWCNEDNAGLRKLLDRAFYSTQYFWASIWFWDPGLVYEGLDGQMRALYKCANLTENDQLIEEGQRIYADLMWEIYDRSRREPARRA